MLKKLTLVCAMLMLSYSLCGCGAQSEDAPASTELQAMDTVMTLSCYGEHADTALAEAKEEIHRLDALLSVSAEESDIRLLNEKKEAMLSKDGARLLSRALTISRDTEGAFEPTIAPLMDAWGFRSKSYTVPDKSTLQSLLEGVGTAGVRLSENGHCLLSPHTSVDLGGIAKGYASDRVMEIFKAHGIHSAIISLGGNIHTLGSKPDASPWRVGIQDPLAPDDLIATIEVHNRAVVTSGGYLRYFEENGVRYHHILDPKTGMPANNGLVSVTIVAKDGTLADALSTALFVMGEDMACDYWRAHKNDFDCVLVTEDGRVLASANIASALSLTSGGKAEVIA